MRVRPGADYFVRIHSIVSKGGATGTRQLQQTLSATSGFTG